MANPGHPYRGIRNDNPGNIKNIPGGWKGQTGIDAGGHAIFSNPVYGARAMSSQLKRNVDVYRTSNLTQLIGGNSRYPGWAPTSDGNNVQNYVNYITAHMNEKGYNITGESDITSLMQDSQFRSDLMKAMTELEGDTYEYFTNEILKAGDEAVGKNEQDINTTPSPSSSASQNPSNSPTNSPNSTPGGNSSAGAAGSTAAPASSSGGGELGFKDPDRNYPEEKYVGEQTTNKAARAGAPEWETRLNLPQSAIGRELLPKEFNPEYPSNKTYETEDKHRIELDDTEGKPRIEYAHMNGSGFSMENEPDKARMLLNSYGDMVELVGNDFTMIVNGNGDILYTGNLNLTVEGNMNLNVKKDLTFRVGGTYREFVDKDKRLLTVGKKNESIGKNYELKVDENFITKVDGKYDLLADYMKISLNDGANISTGETIAVSSDKVQIATGDFTSTSTSIDVQASSGVIGGNAVQISAGQIGQYNSAAVTENKRTNSSEGQVTSVTQTQTEVKNKAGANKDAIKPADIYSGNGGQLV